MAHDATHTCTTTTSYHLLTTTTTTTTTTKVYRRIKEDYYNGIHSRFADDMRRLW